MSLSSVCRIEVKGHYILLRSSSKCVRKPPCIILENHVYTSKEVELPTDYWEIPQLRRCSLRLLMSTSVPHFKQHSFNSGC